MIKKWLSLLFLFAMLVSTGTHAVGYRYNMSYIYFGDSSNYSQLVAHTDGSLNEVAPAYFTLNESGSLQFTPALSSRFIAEMQEAGILVVPFLTNDWDRGKGIAALNNREVLTSQLAEAISAYDLDGVNIDLENLTPTERNSLVDFVRLLRSKLPEGKRIAVAVAANPTGTAAGWAGSFDYAGLAAYSDYLMLMAYDESYNGSKPGPVASYSFVENSLKYALRTVPKEKIVLGLPFYGRIWSDSGSDPSGYGISNTMVETLVKNYNGVVAFDPVSKATRATITIRASDAKPKINGTALSAGTYTIWYSGEQSLKAELELVNRYQIKGTGSWSLGQETEDTWSYFKLWLNGCTFSDIQYSWAKESILTAYLNGWMLGTSSGAFSPNAPVTRAQAAAVLTRLLGLPVQADAAYRFSDCSGHWAEAYIDTARKYGIVSGVGSNLFAPDRPVTREEMAVMLSNILEASGDGTPLSFTDISADLWSYDTITALSGEKILTGYPDGSFRPKNQITRAEMAAMTARIDSASLKR